jgi:hypothetical protein
MDNTVAAPPLEELARLELDESGALDEDGMALDDDDRMLNDDDGMLDEDDALEDSIKDEEPDAGVEVAVTGLLLLWVCEDDASDVAVDVPGSVVEDVATEEEAVLELDVLAVDDDTKDTAALEPDPAADVASEVPTLPLLLDGDCWHRPVASSHTSASAHGCPGQLRPHWPLPWQVRPSAQSAVSTHW